MVGRPLGAWLPAGQFSKILFAPCGLGTNNHQILKNNEADPIEADSIVLNALQQYIRKNILELETYIKCSKNIQCENFNCFRARLNRSVAHCNPNRRR